MVRFPMVKMQYYKLTGTLGTATNLVVPVTEKVYIVDNATTGLIL